MIPSDDEDTITQTAAFATVRDGTAPSYTELAPENLHPGDTVTSTGPVTVSELVLVPAYTQSAWDRRQVQLLKRAEERAGKLKTFIGDNLGRTDDLVKHDLLLALGRRQAAYAELHTALAADSGSIYAKFMLAPRTAEVDEAEDDEDGETP